MRVLAYGYGNKKLPACFGYIAQNKQLHKPQGPPVIGKWLSSSTLAPS
jgi:hypothetical protein